MLRHSLRCLAVAAVAAVMLGPSPAAAVTSVGACQQLDKAGETYIVTADIVNPGTDERGCFPVLADRVTLDLGGHTITGSGSQGVTDVGAARISTVVKNGRVTGFGIGIALQFSSRSTVRNVTASDNQRFGMSIGGPNSLVKDCIVQRNGQDGIVAGDGVQVQGCLIGGVDSGNNLGNGETGLQGGQRMLVTRNTVIGNGIGIVVGPNSTVTHNTAADNSSGGIVAGPQSLVTSNTVNENGQDGIAIGQRSTVTFNTANGNDRDGIQAFCPVTITHNTATGNGGLDIGSLGPGCVIQNNTTTP